MSEDEDVKSDAEKADEKGADKEPETKPKGRTKPAKPGAPKAQAKATDGLYRSGTRHTLPNGTVIVNA